MSAAPSRRRGNDGFLLSETLTTFAISACVLVGLASIGPALFSAVERSVAGVQNTDEINRALVAIRRDVSGLTHARWNGFEPQPFVFRGGPNSLFFARREISPDGLPETHVVALREIVSGGAPRLVRSDAKLSATAASFEELHFGAQRPIGTGAWRLRFWYLPATRGRPTRAASWPVGPQLPQAVEIEAIDPVTTRVIIAMRISLYANADIGCLSATTSPSPIAPPPSSDVSPPQPPIAGPAAATGGPQSPPTATAFCGRTDRDGVAQTAQTPPGPQL